MLSGDEDTPLQEGEKRVPLLHFLADLADPFDYSTHQNQLILAKLLIEHGANVNAVTRPQLEKPLHKTCYWSVATNIDFVELLLEKGADPNAQNYMGLYGTISITKYIRGVESSRPAYVSLILLARSSS
jgi:ankyrin repeat protein